MAINGLPSSSRMHERVIVQVIQSLGFGAIQRLRATFVSKNTDRVPQTFVCPIGNINAFDSKHLLRSLKYIRVSKRH